MGSTGAAWTVSKEDPRWNISISDIRVGGFVMPVELEAAIKTKEEELGEKPPKDLTFQYCKY